MPPNSTANLHKHTTGKLTRISFGSTLIQMQIFCTIAFSNLNAHFDGSKGRWEIGHFPDILATRTLVELQNQKPSTDYGTLEIRNIIFSAQFSKNTTPRIFSDNECITMRKVS